MDRYLTMTAGDELRVALVHTPPGYQAGIAAPLLIDFHGYGGTSERTQADHDFDPLADAARVVTVYPQGLELDVELTGWYTISREDQSDDVAYVAQLLDALERQLCVDPDRVWAVGHSVGGGMADYVACELADRFTAVAIVAGTFYPRDRCEPAEPTAILEVHSTTDDVAPYYGRPYFVSVEAWFAAWADRLHCDPDPSDDGGRVVWNGCDAPLEHVRLEGVGHEWISAETALVWEFLQRAGTRSPEP
ncbi:MAG: PHB depolymerase family esterase [Ilumatobacteraceae bacterium]